MANNPPHQQTNTLGNTSLTLGILGLAFVFGIGLCALVGDQQGWLQVASTILFVCGASSAFLGFIGTMLGLAGLFGANRSRATAIIGILLGLSGVCMFFGIINAVTK
jgi:cytochrome c biogenesis protein CcdA